MPSRVEQGLALHQQGKLREAERVYREVLASQPNHPDALHLLGVIAMEFKQFEQAVQLIESAIGILPTVAFYYNNLGNAQRALGRRKPAYDSYSRALQLKPDYVEARVNRARTLREQAMFAEAIAEYEIAAKSRPDLACGGLGTAYNDQGRVEESIAAYAAAVRASPENADVHTNLLYEMHFSDRVDPETTYREHLRWASVHAEPLTRAARPHANDRAPDRRLKIGYVSGDFRDHPVARFLWPLIEHPDRAKFDVTCFSNVEVPDSVTAEYRSAVDRWHDIASFNDEQAAEFVRQQQIDVLIDLAGHTGGSRMLLFARKPAPVQITYLGYPDTTGMSAMDVRIADALTDPSGAEARCVENLERVDGCFLCYSLKHANQPLSPLPAQSAGRVTFGSFNNLAKISPTTLSLWQQVLVAVPTARLVVKTSSFGDEATVALTQARFERRGMPMDRVEFLPTQTTQQEHLDSYRHIDIALDTFPYCGTTTTCEALASGVPVISLVGNHHAARVGLSLLAAAGHSEWAAASPDRFVHAATHLAGDLSRLATLRVSLRAELSQSTLCNAAAFAAKIERIYRDAWARYCRR